MGGRQKLKGKIVNCFIFECKRAFRISRLSFLWLFLWVFLLSAAAFVMSRVWDKPLLNKAISIGVVMQEDDRLSSLVLRELSEQEDINQMCRFLRVTQEEGFGMLESGQISALFLLPYQVVEGVLTGVNEPATLYLNKQGGADTILLKELTMAGVRILGTAQSQVYEVYDLLGESLTDESLKKIQDTLNRQNMNMLLGRQRMFHTQVVRVTGEIPEIFYFASSAVVLFLFFFSSQMGQAYGAQEEEWLRQQKRRGIGFSVMSAAKIASVFFFLLPFAFLFAGMTFILMQGMGQDVQSFAALHPDVTVPGFFAFLLMILLASGYVSWIFSMARSSEAAMLFNTSLSFLMVLLSGGIIPSVFLPDQINYAAEFFWGTPMIRLAAAFYTGKIVPGSMRAGMIWCIIFYCLTVWNTKRRAML